jgi:hypothetical protein
MTDTILLDLNSTYAANASQVHLMSRGIYYVQKETYRSWLTELMRDRHVLMLTSRPDGYRVETLERIQRLEDWQPDLALFNQWRLRAPDAKLKMLQEVVYPKFGTPDERSYLAIESNIKTRAMFAQQGIRAITQQQLYDCHALVEGPTTPTVNLSLF